MSFREEEIIVLIDEDDNEIEFEIIEIFETENGNQYAFLFPLDEEEESIIMKVVIGEDDEEILVEIDDDEEWNEVINAWEDYISKLDEEE
jgi:uncharacterized protein YrzB (UPF0473 family)